MSPLFQEVTTVVGRAFPARPKAVSHYLVENPHRRHFNKNRSCISGKSPCHAIVDTPKLCSPQFLSKIKKTRGTARDQALATQQAR
jgi:hypothetical protein